jgi:hypothetical protein
MRAGIRHQHPTSSAALRSGAYWEILKHSPEPVEEIVYASKNAEMILRVAEATGRAAHSEELDDTWLLVTFAGA